MDFPPDTRQQFLAVSSVLTAFSETDLIKTGQADAYWGELVSIVGVGIMGDFLSECARAFEASRDLDDLERRFAQRIMNSGKYGPLAQNIIALWYMGQWNALPPGWCDEYGGSVDDVTHVLSPQAYTEGLVWPAFGSHPRAAKATGYGSWATPPLMPVNTELFQS